VKITMIAKRMEPNGTKHEHIDRLKFVYEDGSGQDAQKQKIIEWLESNPNNTAWCHDGPRVVQVKVVNDTPKYLRTVADGYYTNNLLALPDF